MLSVLGLAAIKNLYIYFRNVNELALKAQDYFLIGFFSGIFLTQIILGSNFLLYGSVIGGVYGYFYSLMINYFIKKRRKRAEKLGIIL
jgi:hypothetical protein